MNITIEFHGVLERLAGAASMPLIVADGAVVADALELLTQKAPNLVDTVGRSACAVGDSLVSRSDVLTHGARLALLPPVAGG